MDILSRIVILLARVLLGMDTIQAALLRLVQAMDSAAIETIPKNIERIVTNTQLAVQHPTTGLALIMPAIAELRAYVTTQDSGLLAAIAALPAGSAIPSASDNAAGVWAAKDLYRLPEDVAYGEELYQAAQWAYLMRWAGSVPGKMSPFFNVSYPPPIPD
jgi:hypothetical protein